MHQQSEKASMLNETSFSNLRDQLPFDPRGLAIDGDGSLLILQRARLRSTDFHDVRGMTVGRRAIRFSSMYGGEPMLLGSLMEDKRITSDSPCRLSLVPPVTPHLYGKGLVRYERALETLEQGWPIRLLAAIDSARTHLLSR